VSLSDWTSVIGLAFAALAGFFAWRAVHWARQTVKDGETASREAADRHDEQIAEMRAATTAAAAQHSAEMADRERLAAVENADRQLVQLERISDLIMDILNRAREEHINPPPNIGLGLTGSQLAPMCIRLENALAALYGRAMPSPVKARDLASRGRGAGTPASNTYAMAVDALLEIHQLTLHFASGGVVPARVPTQ
jgi:hypothetical protein